MQPPANAPFDTPRQHERYELYASVQLTTEGETLILPARNISLGGVSLAADGHDLSGSRVGSALKVWVFDALNSKRRPLELAAEVVRHDPDGIALMWTSTDPAQAMRLTKLLESLRPKRRGRAR